MGPSVVSAIVMAASLVSSVSPSVTPALLQQPKKPVLLGFGDSMPITLKRMDSISSVIVVGVIHGQRQKAGKVPMGNGRERPEPRVEHDVTITRILKDGTSSLREGETIQIEQVAGQVETDTEIWASSDKPLPPDATYVFFLTPRDGVYFFTHGTACSALEIRNGLIPKGRIKDASELTLDELVGRLRALK